MRWLQGYDPRPLVPFSPAVVLTDKMVFEDGVETAPQLVFAIRGMISRLSSRLTGRRQATNRIDIVLHYDKTMARFSAAEASARASNWRVSNLVEDVTRVALSVDLPAPLSSTEDLFRAIKAKVETLSLLAPCVALDLSLSRLMEAPALQLDLSRASRVSPEALPALLSELSAELGAERVGMLKLEDDHRPEHGARLEWSNVLSENRARTARRASVKAQTDLKFSVPKPEEPSRLLPTPVALGPFGATRDGSKRGSSNFLKSGGTLVIDSETFTIRSVQFDRRMDSVVWWTKVSPSRDYLRVELELPASTKRSAESAATILAWIYIDRKTGEAFLHGFWE
jgi:protein ImuB